MVGLWEPSPIGGAGDREVYSAVFSRVLLAVIAHSTERLCVFAFANHSGCLDETNTDWGYTGHTEINHVGVFLKHSV